MGNIERGVRDTRSGAQMNVSAIYLFHYCCPCSLDLSTKSVFVSTKHVPLGIDHHRIVGDDEGGLKLEKFALLHDLNIS